MARRSRPRHPLKAVKAAFAHAARINWTITAADGAAALDMDEYAVVEVVANLRARDFDKSMPSEVDPSIWQDVYKPIVESRELYVKFTLDVRGRLFLISFKGNEP